MIIKPNRFLDKHFVDLEVGNYVIIDNDIIMKVSYLFDAEDSIEYKYVPYNGAWIIQPADRHMSQYCIFDVVKLSDEEAIQYLLEN